MSRSVSTPLILLLLSSALQAAQRPNVLFLFADDQRPDTIAALGNPHIKTPHLDHLVQRGFVFRNAYCMGSTRGAVCNPSRHMMLSGMSLYRYNAKKREGTFGDVMRKAGFVTYHQSKRGNTAREYHKAFEHTSYLDDGAVRSGGHHGQTAADNAIGFLTRTWKREAPFFMYVGFAGPHDPRRAAKKWLNLYQRDKIPLPENYRPFHPVDNDEMFVRDERLAPWPRTPAVVRRHLHDYYGCISSIDHHVGRVIATLKTLGVLENTIIVYAADHGLAIGSHGLFGKQNLYEHSMGAPLIVAGPGISKGETVAFAYLFDIFPTVCDLVDVSVPEGLDGRSQAPVIHGKASRIRDTVFLSYREGQRAVRQGNWKLIRYPQVNYSQLFDLGQDPHELKNLSGDPTQSRRVEEMMQLLARQQAHWNDRLPLTSKQPRPAVTTAEFFRKAPAKKKRKKRKAKKKAA